MAYIFGCVRGGEEECQHCIGKRMDVLKGRGGVYILVYLCVCNGGYYAWGAFGRWWTY